MVGLHITPNKYYSDYMHLKIVYGLQIIIHSEGMKWILKKTKQNKTKKHGSYWINGYSENTHRLDQLPIYEKKKSNPQWEKQEVIFTKLAFWISTSK